MAESLKQFPRPLVPYAMKVNDKTKPFVWKDSLSWMYNKLPYLLFGSAVFIIIIIVVSSNQNEPPDAPFIEPGAIFDYSEFQDNPPGLREKLQAEANKTRELIRQQRSQSSHFSKAVNDGSPNSINNQNQHIDSFRNPPKETQRHTPERQRGNRLGRPVIDGFVRTGTVHPELQGQNSRQDGRPGGGGRPKRDGASDWLSETGAVTGTGSRIGAGDPGNGIDAGSGVGYAGDSGSGVGYAGSGVGYAGDSGSGVGYAGDPGSGVGDTQYLDGNSEAETILEQTTGESNCLPLCPLTPPNLKGRQAVLTVATERQARDVATTSGVRDGGTWAPRHCGARYAVAVIVPVRDRREQEWAFLTHMHGFLQRQQLNYTIYVVEQTAGSLFNRAKLLNVGFLTATQRATYDCVVFHDVDMLPEDDRHLYHCSAMPRHLVVASSNNKYKSAMSFQRNRYFGGACMMTPRHVWEVNGWSNRYWGWGGEDDDLWRRLGLHDLPVWRWPAALARYTMLPHGPPPGVNARSYETLARLAPFHRRDGLNSIQFTLVDFTTFPHHTRLLVDVGSPEDDPPLGKKFPSALGRTGDVNQR